ncbi:F-box protein At5g62510-like [Chenopodium quinoa]|uniref:F-box protein At5g62510-like n=1 Tax=Chenopodium quinoa TaxID=63459 RepID=UPI000B7764F8|nr:F-box protein At5g62510-like [Chenopodium quinoa]
MALTLQRCTYSFLRKKDGNCPFNQRNEIEHERTIVGATDDRGGLPKDLLIEILSRLPVTDLSRYKCVCKSWYSLISCSDFISKYLKNYYHKDHSWHGCLLAVYPNPVCMAALDTFQLSIDETPKVFASETIDLRPMGTSDICGPCDGIYYLYQYNFAERVLWNPVTNELKLLPPVITKPNFPSNLTDSVCEAYGLGFDPLNKDYKVVVIKCYWPEDYEAKLSLYLHPSLSTHCGLILGLIVEIYPKFMSLNWEQISVANFLMEAITEIHTPIYEKPASRSLAIYHNSVAYLTLHEINKSFVVWMLNEGLWTKKFSIGPLSGIRCPLGHWRDDNLILDSDNGRLILFDLVT